MGTSIQSITNKRVKKTGNAKWMFLTALLGVFLYIIIAGRFTSIHLTSIIGLITIYIASLISLRYYDFMTLYEQESAWIRRKEKQKATLWIAIATVLGITLLILPFVDNAIPYYFLFVELCFFIVISVIVLKYYDLPVIGFLTVFIGLFTKKLHWPFAGQEMTMGTGLLIVVSIYISGIFIKNFRDKQFLRWFGSIAGVIIILFMTGMLIMNMHWNGRIFFISTGCFLFILYVLALVFKLPDANYIVWSQKEKRIFYRAVMIPLIFIFALIVLIVVFPETYNAIMGRMGTSGFVPGFEYEYNTVELFNLEGLLPY